MHMIVQFATPFGDAKKMQLHVRMLIKMLTHDPRIGLHDFDAELFLQFADQRFARRFPCLDLATGELPVAGIEGASRTLTEQIAAVRAQQNGRGDVGDFHIGNKRLATGLQAFFFVDVSPLILPA